MPVFAKGFCADPEVMLTRRAMLSKLAWGVAGVASAAVPVRFGSGSHGNRPLFSPQDEVFLDELELASFRALWENSHPRTGMVKDKAQPGPAQLRSVSSIAATGFGLSAWGLAVQRGWLKRAEALERTRATLRFLANELPNEHGFFYHFVDWGTGQREWQCEVSSIDTAILLCGVLTCRQNFNDAEIQDLAGKIFDRVDWQWLYRDGPFLGHGWTPEHGFLASRWDTYCEHMLLYLLAIGANNHAIPATTWNAWRRPWVDYEGMRYIDDNASLFIHQYSHAWFDFHGRRDKFADYFENSVLATRAHQKFCASLRAEFPHYADGLWGLTASSSPKGYVVWGGPPRLGPIDGTVVPCATGGSLPFLPQESLQVLQQCQERFGKLIWSRLGFVDAFNPLTGWVASEQILINTGITLLMAENARTGFFWETFMKNPEARRGMDRTGFHRPDWV
jgi:hypothetical protein